MMASYDPDPDKVSRSECVAIDTYELIDNITLYHIRVTVGEYFWIVKHRYSEFYELNEKLVSENGLDRSLLPPKKLFGNQSENFLQKRKSELENYLQVLMSTSPLSPYLCTFLEFYKYEIHGITQSLAEELFYQGDSLLHSGELYSMTPVQLNALMERLKLPIPTCDSGDRRKDIGHILDFLSRIQNLLICGSNKPIGSSNIIPNKLPFDLSPLKNLQLLKLDGCDPRMVRGLINVRKTVTKLQVQESMKNLKDLLLCDVLHWDPCFSPPTSIWNSTIYADFSYNHLTAVDNSIWLLPQVEILDLSHNQISDINYLDHLTHLNNVDFSFNCFTVIPSLHTRLGNIVTLNFSGNSIEFLHGFSKLYSLVHLDLQSNKIASISEIFYLSSLPCLENLNLTGNPLTTIIDYRTRVLEQFNNRASEICLDNEAPTQKELDTVAILQALRRAKEIGKSASSNCTVTTEKSEPKTSQNTCMRATSHSGRRVKTPKHPSCSSTSDITDFRQYVESIRAQGGVGWLRLWNQCLKESKHKTMETVCSPSTSMHQDNSEHKSKVEKMNKLDENNDVIINNTQPKNMHSSSMQVTDDSTDHLTISNERHKKIERKLICMSKRDFILPEWLPSFSNKLFLSYVESLISNISFIERSNSSQSVANSFLALPYWTIGIYSLNFIQQYVFPACLIGVHNCILVFLLTDIQQDGSPSLSLFKRLYLNTVSKISVGRYHHYLQIEVKNETTFYIFKFPSRNMCAQFLNSVQVKHQEQERRPVKITYRELKTKSSKNANLLHETLSYSWVAVDTPIDIGIGSFPCIAVTKGNVCLIQERFANSSMPNCKEDCSTIKIIQKWDVMDHITDLSLLNPVMNVVNTLSDNESNSKTDINKNSDSTQEHISTQLKDVLVTSGFGVVLHLQNSEAVAIRFPISESRDEFLEAFTKERFSRVSKSKGLISTQDN